MINTTKIKDLIPQVLADQILIEINKINAFNDDKLLTVYNSVKMRPGRTLEIGSISGLSNFELKPEGEATTSDDFSATIIKIKPETYQKIVDFTRESTGGYAGDLAADISKAIALAYVNSVNDLKFKTLKSIDNTNDFVRDTNIINYKDIVELTSLEAYSRPSDYTLFLSNKQRVQVLNMKDDNNNPIMVKVENGLSVIYGQVYMIDGINIVFTDQIVSNGDKFENYLVENGAIALVPAGELQLRNTEDIKTGVETLVSDFVSGFGFEPFKTVRRVIFKATE